MSTPNQSNHPHRSSPQLQPSTIHALTIWGRVFRRQACTLARDMPLRLARRYGVALDRTEYGVAVAWDDGSLGFLSPSVLVDVPAAPLPLEAAS